MSAAERVSRSSFRKLLPISQPRAMTLLPDRVWSEDPERYRSSSEEFDCVLAEQVISNVILGEDAVDLRESDLGRDSATVCRQCCLVRWTA